MTPFQTVFLISRSLGACLIWNFVFSVFQTSLYAFSSLFFQPQISSSSAWNAVFSLALGIVLLWSAPVIAGFVSGQNLWSGQALVFSWAKAPAFRAQEKILVGLIIFVFACENLLRYVGMIGFDLIQGGASPPLTYLITSLLTITIKTLLGAILLGIGIQQLRRFTPNPDAP